MSKARETANITTSDQTIAGVKTFSDKPQVPNATTGSDAVNFSQVIGLGQTWQNVTASRLKNVVYTNTTGKPICLGIRFSDRVNTGIFVDGFVIAYYNDTNSSPSQAGGMAIVPSGSTYELRAPAGFSGFSTWAELR
jgi:hypothetical protein